MAYADSGQNRSPHSRPYMGISLNIANYYMTIYRHICSSIWFPPFLGFRTRRPRALLSPLHLKRDPMCRSFRRRIALSLLAVLLSPALPSWAQESVKPEAPVAKPQGPPALGLKVVDAQAPYEP